MGFATVVAAVISGAGAFAAGTTFFGLSVATSSLIVAGAVGLGLNYLRNITPGVPSQSPQDFDFRVTRPAATTPARFVYGRVRVGGHPIALEEFEYDDDAFVGYRDYQITMYLMTEGQTSSRGMVESVWLNGRRMPYVPTTTADFGQLKGALATTTVNGQSHVLGSNTHLDAPIALWESRKTTVRGALTDPDNPPRGVDILLGHIQDQIDDLTDRRGRRQQFTPTRTWVGPDDGIQWEDNLPNVRGIESNIKIFEHWGGTDFSGIASHPIRSAMRSWKRRSLDSFTGTDDVRGTVKWDPETGLMNGISALMLELRDPGPRREAPFLTSSPRAEYLIKGRVFTWPGQSTPAWTENAAAIYYDWLVNVQGIDADTIDTDSFTAAYDYCNERIIVPAATRTNEKGIEILTAQFGSDTSTWPAVAIQDIVIEIWNETYAGDDNAEIRYSINGIVSTDMDPREVEKQFNAAWGGYAVERGGKIYFEPGRDRPISRVLGESHIVDGTNPSWQIEPPLQSKTTSVTCTLAQSRQHEWLSYSMPKQEIGGEPDDFPRDLGSWTYVAYPMTASRLLRQALYKANGGKSCSLTVTRGSNWDHYRIAPTDRIGLNLPSEGHDDATVKWHVDRVETTMDGTVNLEVRQERPGTYDDIITTPIEIGASSRTGGLVPSTRRPPDVLVVERIGIQNRQTVGGIEWYGNVMRVTVDGIAPQRSFDLEWVQRRADDTLVDRDSLTVGVGVNEGGLVRLHFLDNEHLSKFYVWDTDPVRSFDGTPGSHQWEFRFRYNNGLGFVSRWTDIVVVDLELPVNVPDSLIQSGFGV